MGKAETLHFKDDTYFFTGAGQRYQVPSVIRLKYNIKKKGNPVYKVSRMGVFSRDNFTCQNEKCKRWNSQVPKTWCNA